ncbi:MAG: hypothetical protein JNJ73_17425 [Hyphomonadaceae bacterium]|nr:hypothetical protein [Hyphomonadaceae bacterium]
MLPRALKQFGGAGETSHVGSDVECGQIRVVSFVYPKSEDWRAVRAFGYEDA